MPFTFPQLRIVGPAWTLALCLLTSCVPIIGQPPALPPPPDIRHDDPARDAQARLLKEAYRAFVQERYPAAVLFFRRFIDDAANAPRVAEARWWLGRAHEQLGEYRSAIAQYRALAAGQPPERLNGALYEQHARHRLEELRQLHPALTGREAKQLALRVTVDQLPSASDRESWFRALAKEGVSALVLEPARTTGRAQTYVETVKGVVMDAHHVGLLVWPVLDLHQGTGLEPRPEWAATAISSGLGEGGSRQRSDVAHHDYHAYLEEFIRTLSRTGVDGILLAARTAAGFAREYSGTSFAAFASVFGVSVPPEEVFAVGMAGERSATYWRWVGWKGRMYVKLVARLRKALRESNPTALVLVEVHQSTVGSPLQGLEQYGEDLAELVQRTGSTVVVRREDDHGEGSLEKLEAQAGTSDRIWVAVPAKTASVPPSMGALTPRPEDLTEGVRWNVMIIPESSTTVP